MIISLKDFEAKLNENPQLLEEMKAAIQKIEEGNTAANEVEAFTMAAKTIGFDISVEELMRSQADKQALDDDELNMIAAGYEKEHDGKDRNHCDSKYWCDLCYFHDAFMHDANPKNVQCLAYYLCDHFFN